MTESSQNIILPRIAVPALWSKFGETLQTLTQGWRQRKADRATRRQALRLAETSPHLLADLGYALETQTSSVEIWSGPTGRITVQIGGADAQLFIGR